MQIMDISKDLSYAIDLVEEILNGNDGDVFLESIKKYKQTKELDNHTLLKVRNYLS